MRKIFATLLLSMLFIATNSHAQSKTKVKKRIDQPMMTAEMQKYNNMIGSTAKIMFVDSVVVDKKDFIKYIPNIPELGKYTTTDIFLKRNTGNDNPAYINEMENICYFVAGDTIKGNRIYSTSKIGGQWEEPRALDELEKGFTDPNYPFLMSDGITLFFAAKGENSIGGYDIFMTRMDNANERFYKPENYGLPFNSPYNDYLLIYDDLDSLGWLVSDRFLPSDKVCIYTFVPTNPRLGFDSDNITQDELKNYAALNSISSTWKFGDREKANERLKRISKTKTTKSHIENDNIIIDDNLTYRSPQDFKSSKALEFYILRKRLKLEYQTLSERLQQTRAVYKKENNENRTRLAQEILETENKLRNINEQITNTEKEIRANEKK